MRSRALAALAAGTILAVPTAAQADVFNGRIAFSSFRAVRGQPPGTSSASTTTAVGPAEADHQPGGRRAVGLGARRPRHRLPHPQAGPDDQLRGLADDRRRQGAHAAHGHAGRARPPASRPGGRTAAACCSGAAGPRVRDVDDGHRRQEPGAAVRPAGHQFYPSDLARRAAASCSRASKSPTRRHGPRDRDEAADGGDLSGRCSTAPAPTTPRPPGRRTARRSRSSPTLNDSGPATRSNDMEIWVMDADGTNPSSSPPTRSTTKARRGHPTARCSPTRAARTTTTSTST